MTNKTTLIIIAISLVAALVGLIISFFDASINLADLLLTGGYTIAQFLGLLILLYNGSLIGTKYFRIIQFLTGITILGALFKIMHWPGANEMLLISLNGIALTYLVRFINKKQKGHLDILKLLWVLTTYISVALVLLHWIPREITYIGNILFWITFIDYVVIGIKSKTLFDE